MGIIFLWFVVATCGDGLYQMTKYTQFQDLESAIQASRIVEADCVNTVYVGELKEYREVTPEEQNGDEPKAEEPKSE